MAGQGQHHESNGSGYGLKSDKGTPVSWLLGVQCLSQVKFRRSCGWRLRSQFWLLGWGPWPDPCPSRGRLRSFRTSLNSAALISARLQTMIAGSGTPVGSQIRVKFEIGSSEILQSALQLSHAADSWRSGNQHRAFSVRTSAWGFRTLGGSSIESAFNDMPRPLADP